MNNVISSASLNSSTQLWGTLMKRDGLHSGIFFTMKPLSFSWYPSPFPIKYIRSILHYTKDCFIYYSVLTYVKTIRKTWVKHPPAHVPNDMFRSMYCIFWHMGFLNMTGWVLSLGTCVLWYIQTIGSKVSWQKK